MTFDPNSMAIEDRAFVERACNYLEDTMSEAEFADFQDELRGNADRQEMLMQLAAQEVLLVQCGDGMVSEGIAKQTWQLDRRRLRVAVFAGIAALLVIGLSSYFFANAGKASPLHLEQVAAAKFIDATLLDDEFRNVQLSDGIAAFSLRNEVRLIASDRCRASTGPNNLIKLQHGTLAITVPDGAKGVRIVTPHAAFRDIGTHFVVNVNAHRTELHVVSGEVAVMPGDIDDVHRAVAIVGEHQAVRIRDLEAADGLIHTKFEPQKFALEVPSEIPIPVVNTGLQQKLGDSDGYWAILSLPNDIGSNMQRAAVVTLNSYEPNDAATSQWISISHPLPMTPGNAKYQFRTGFELNGCKPATARLTGRFWVDNFVTAIRLNGIEQPLPDQRSSGLNHPPGAATDFVIASGFRNGFNILEFDVINSFSEGAPDGINPLAFRCEFAGTVKVAKDPPEAAADPELLPLPQQ